MKWGFQKKSISVNPKLRHYNSIIRPEILYAADNLTINGANKTDTETRDQGKNHFEKDTGPKDYKQGKRIKETSEGS